MVYGREEVSDDVINKFKDVLSSINKKERKVIEVKHGLYDGIVKNNKQAATLLKVTEAEVIDLEKHGILTLKHPVRIKRIFGI